MTDAIELLAVAKRAAAAGAAVLSRRSAAGTGGVGLGISNKGDAGDWVTEFDVAAENAVREAILAERPNDTITGEEHGTTRPEQASGYRWSIDPLDGTTNFIRNIVYYATSVAVADADGVWLAGVVHAPALGRFYSAARGEGAWLEVAGETTRLAGPVPGRTGLILATGFSYDPDTRANQAEGLAELMNGFADVRRLGSAALDLCLVADGTYDADVAKAAQVSKAQAARALGNYGAVSDDVRERVLAAAEELEYRPNELARSMNTGKSHTIGVVVGDIENPHFGLATRGITDTAKRSGDRKSVV